MKNLLRLIGATVLLISLLSPVKASVLYEFDWGDVHIDFLRNELITGSTVVDSSSFLPSSSSPVQVSAFAMFHWYYMEMDSAEVVFWSDANTWIFRNWDGTPNSFGTYTEAATGAALRISEFSAVPEPSTLALLGLGLAGLAASRRRKQSH